MEKLLETRSLTKLYGDVIGVNDITLDLEPGVIGLLGPNGAGKSSLMRTIATLQSPDQGSLTFGDIDILKDPQALRATLGYLPQDFGVYPRMSARAMRSSHQYGGSPSAMQAEGAQRPPRRASSASSVSAANGCV